MFASFRTFSQYLRCFGLIVVAGVVLLSCAPAGNKPAVQTSPYERSKDAFKSGDFDKALDLTDKLAVASPPADCTDRARVLRAVIYTGKLKSASELAEAYSKGADTAKSPQFKSEYLRLHHDNLMAAATAALGLAETAHQIAPDGVMAKQVVLEASYPTTEGPVEVSELARVEQGGWIESDQQDNAAADALRKGMDNALAEAVAGDRAKARLALANGSTQLDSTAFAIFLTKQLADGATVFDRHHGRDPQKLLTLCDQGELSLKAALALLKDTPNKDQQKEALKLQDRFKTLRKDK
jgi:hypothetical protein